MSDLINARETSAQRFNEHNRNRADDYEEVPFDVQNFHERFRLSIAPENASFVNWWNSRHFGETLPISQKSLSTWKYIIGTMMVGGLVAFTVWECYSYFYLRASFDSLVQNLSLVENKVKDFESRSYDDARTVKYQSIKEKTLTTEEQIKDKHAKTAMYQSSGENVLKTEKFSLLLYKAPRSPFGLLMELMVLFLTYLFASICAAAPPHVIAPRTPDGRTSESSNQSDLCRGKVLALKSLNDFDEGISLSHWNTSLIQGRIRSYDEYIVIEEPGIYFVYAQLYLHSNQKSTEENFHFFIRKNRHVKLAVATLPKTSCETYCTRFVSVIASLEANDDLTVATNINNLHFLMTCDKALFGAYLI